MAARTVLQLEGALVVVAVLKDSPDKLLNFSGRRRLPVILQTEVAECGLACLAMIGGFYGYHTDMTSIRRRFPISSHGVTLKHLIDMAARLQLSSRALRLEPDELAQLQLPCILHWEMNHFVVLKQIRHNAVVIHDPATGERVISKEALAKQFTGIALELVPTEGFTPAEDKRPLKLSQFWSRIIGLKRSLLQVLALSLLLQLFAVVTPLYMQTVVDDVVLRKDTNLLFVLAIGFGLLMLVETGTRALREFVILHLSNRLNIQMAANLFRHLIRLPMDYFSKRHIGDIVSRFGSLDTVRQLLTTGLIGAVVDGIMAVITLIAMLIYDARLTLIVTGIVVLYALIRLALYRPLRRLTEESIVAAASTSSHFMESVRAIQTIKLFQRENERQSQWQNRLAETMNKNIGIARWNIGYQTINHLLFGLENLIVIYFAATAVMGNIISLGMLYAFMSYKLRFVQSMDGLITRWIEIKMLGLHLDRLADMAFTEAEAIDNQVAVSARENTLSDSGYSSLQGKIEVRNLSFRYSETEPLVIRDLSFEIMPGETVAITGSSGCGKTTLIKCMMGLLTPTEGEILIDGQPLHQLPHYRSQIAGVMQDDTLMSGAIADNIGCFESQLDMERVIQCAQMACVHEDIMQMSMQYNTLVGDMGTSLSGGQKQRIVLARALYREPRILFMDEATSHLDVTSEDWVNHYIKGLNITRVLVAHRPETVDSAERRISLASRTG